jgi:hypothetical protein
MFRKLKEDYHLTEFGLGIDEFGNFTDPNFFQVLWAMIEERYYSWKRARCKHEHKVSTDYYGPDSGYMGCRCLDCGAEWGGRLY